MEKKFHGRGSGGARGAMPPGSAKKGLGVCGAETTADELRGLGLGWYYNWRPTPKIGPVPGVEFVPMFWSDLDVTAENLDAVGRSGATHVLGFNEPDMNGQANMSPEACLALWPKLMMLPQRLGSPAPADSTWMEKFLPEALRRGLRVDFICLHRYPDISDPGAADKIGDMLSEAHRRYGLPVWLTECGAADVSAWRQPQLAKPTPGMARRFLKNLLAVLASLPFVERYAWFADRVGDEYRLGTIFAPGAPRITPFGKLYREA
jgi:hypothetical protein